MTRATSLAVGFVIPLTFGGLLFADPALLWLGLNVLLAWLYLGAIVGMFIGDAAKLGDDDAKGYRTSQNRT